MYPKYVLSRKQYQYIMYISIHFIFQIYSKVTSDSYISNIRSKISDNFTSLDPKYYGADFDLPVNHGTANIVAIDSMGNVVVATSTLNT